jgi:4-hydroxybenzoate polyprenyltransferase
MRGLLPMRFGPYVEGAFRGLNGDHFYTAAAHAGFGGGEVLIAGVVLRCAGLILLLASAPENSTQNEKKKQFFHGRWYFGAGMATKIQSAGKKWVSE